MATCILQGICVKQQQSCRLNLMPDFLGHQTSACSAQNCNNNGMFRQTCTWVQSGSSHKVSQGCVAMQQVRSRPATHLDSKCTGQNIRHRVPVLLEQASLLAQLSC